MMILLNGIDFLKDKCHELTNRLGLTPRVAVEIEFYLTGSLDADINAYLSDCYAVFETNRLSTGEIKKETGPEQYEICIGPENDPVLLASAAEKVKALLSMVAQEHNFTASFEAKPFKGRPGSGLHIHVSVINSMGRNLFSREGGTQEETETLCYAVAGLCATMCEAMVFFAPTDLSYKRFQRDPTAEQYPFDFAPTTVSWGGNNRTVAIRIPTSTTDPKNRHIEHRVAGADACPAAVMAIILAGIIYGIDRRLKPKTGKIYGNAFDPQFNLRLLPNTLKTADLAYNNGIIIKKIIQHYV